MVLRDIFITDEHRVCLTMPPGREAAVLTAQGDENFDPPPWLQDEYTKAVLRHLREHGSATKQDLLYETCELVNDGSCSDHDRVRVAVTLQTDILPKLADAGFITHDETEVELEFLPVPVFEWIDSL